MTYKELLKNYEEILNFLPIFKRTTSKTVEYLEALQKGAYRMYRACREDMNFKPETRLPSKEEQRKLCDPENKVEPHAILLYRGQEVPVYFDDPGQQEYIIFEGQTFGGGAYNLMCDIDFCDYIDTILDQKVLNSLKNSEKN